LKAQPVLAATYLTAAIAFLALPVRLAAPLFSILVAIEATIGVYILIRRWSMLMQSVWVLFIVGIYLSAISATVLGEQVLTAGAGKLHGPGVAITVASLACYAAATARFTHPLLGVTSLRRTLEVALAGFVAVLLAYAWTVEDRSSGQLMILGTVAGLGAACLGVASVTSRSQLRALGRPADVFVIFAGALFAATQSVILILRAASIETNLLAVANITVNVLLLIGMAHSRGDAVGRPVQQLSDLVPRGAMSYTLAALLLCDGLMVALSRLTTRVPLSLAFGVAVAVQFIALTWAAVTWLESDAARTWRSHRRVAKDLRGALVRGEIEPYYQSIVRISDGAVMGYEALARWNHPTRGVLAAGDFMDIANERGYLAAIERDMLIAAARHLPSLLNCLSADEPFVTVNVSPTRLMQAGFANEMLNRLQDEKLGVDGLILEITETTPITDWNAFGRNIAAFLEAGVGLAVDDFGTGFASLSLLSQLDVDMIKLDRELIERAMADERGATVVRGAIDTARATGSLIVAEGVSDPSWVGPLARLGADFVQGFAVSVPLPYREIMLAAAASRATAVAHHDDIAVAGDDTVVSSLAPKSARD
jgi:EAL domain-containing protein (putative c-di-GMP-specific phosphodiesterase class I)